MPRQPAPPATPAGRPSRGSRWARSAAGLVLGLAGCASFGSDVHLAPLYSRHATAEGGSESEALAGFYYSRRLFEAPALEPVGPEHASGARLNRPTPSERTVARALRPLWGWRELSADEERVDYLVPLGFWRRRGPDVISMLVPAYFYRSAPAGWRSGNLDPSGPREFDLIALPGVIFSRNARGAEKTGWFPFFGELTDFATYDRVRWFLFPLYLGVDRGRESYHNVLFPILGFSTRGEHRHFRLWPLFGWHVKPGSFERRFWLWPFLHYSREGLHRPPAERTRRWMFFPFFGLTKDRTYRAVSVLWPFFGYAWDPRGERLREELGQDPGDPEATRAFWAWDGPWPLVRIQGGGLNPQAERRERFWPFYSYFEGDSLRAWSWAWPFFTRRLEDGPDYRRASFYALPVYQHWNLRGVSDPRVIKFRRFWPLYTYDREGGVRRFAAPSLDPLTRGSPISFYWGWLWELYAVETERERIQERSWLGLYWRESNAQESRRSLSGLWSSRRYPTAAGEVSETALLFGLLRWRSGPAAARPGLLAPAFPGPGWPATWIDAPPAPALDAGRKAPPDGGPPASELPPQAASAGAARPKPDQPGAAAPAPTRSGKAPR